MSRPKPYRPLTHQVAGAKFLVKKPAAGLFIDVGWGKTATALSAIVALLRARVVRRVLVIAPKRVCELVWMREHKAWREFSHLSAVFLHGPRKDELLEEEHQIYAINPDGLQWLIGACGMEGFDWLIVDESTMFKHPTTRRFKLLRRHLGKFKRRTIMSAEPAPNGLLDLFGQVYILDFGKALGEYITRYRTEYFYPSGFRGYEWKPQAGAEKRIYARLEGLICRPLADPRMRRPRVIQRNVPVVLPKEAMDTYSSLEVLLRAQIRGNRVTAKNGAVATMQCRQVTGGALYENEHTTETQWLHVHDEKLEALAELVNELNGKPLLVFYDFDHERQRILRRFAGVATDFSDKNLSEVEERWNAGEITMLLAQPMASARGLNLQKACSHGCWFTLPWDLELYKQGIGRLARQGAAGKSVTIHHLVAEGTIDEYVAAVLRKKERTQDDLKKALEEMAYG